MNLVLLYDDDFVDPRTVALEGRRRTHVLETLRASPGDDIRAGLLGGEVGVARVLADDGVALRLEVKLGEPPPARPGVDLLVAVPRPKALKKLLPAVASLGVDRMVLVNSARVEKSYFDTKALEPRALAALLDLGLEQARDTVRPEVLVRKRFRPFVEDELDAVFGSGTRLLPHPSAVRPLRDVSRDGRVVLAIGPEGGWVPFEVELFDRAGFVPVSLGPRTLRVEVAVPALIGALGRHAP
jgi:RsmE family RNA methyltransferase